MALVAVSTRLVQSMSPARPSAMGRFPPSSGLGGVWLTEGDTLALMLTEETCGECLLSFAERLDTLGLEAAEGLEITVAGRAIWKLTSAEALSDPIPAIFSLDLDFIKDSSDSVFLGSLERGES